MTFTPHGHHLIAGTWEKGSATFPSQPAHGPAHMVACGDAAVVDRAVRAADAAFDSFGASPRALRAALLDSIAAEIEARAVPITEIGSRETGLPAARLDGERGRTIGQLRLFAEHIRQGDYLERRHDGALPDRQPQPRPDLRLIQRPIGPVAVFGASNFPLAFSVAGGDTASALAAGCPVVVKGHEAHPGTSEIVAEAILAALRRHDIDAGVFSLVHGGSHSVGTALATHPLIQAVGFTGSLAGGRALFDLCAARPVPIPFFGELGSVNPMFLLPQAISKRGAAIAAGWASSLTLGAGQFCTNPGVAVILDSQAETFAAATASGLAAIGPQTMLTPGIADAYRAGRDRIGALPQTVPVFVSPCDGRSASPALFRVSATDWLNRPDLRHEVFGPLGLIVTVENDDQMLEIARTLDGQLTTSVHLDHSDTPLAARLLPLLERKSGRILANGFPTGVEVADAMVHGGPYPASTNFGATSVGTLAIRRWLRPVCYQNLPADLLPLDAR